MTGHGAPRGEFTTPPTNSAHFQLYRRTANSPVRWRLLGGNNRALGRSALDYQDPTECFSALGELQWRLAELAGRVDRHPPNLWVWRLYLEGADVAVSAHPYDRQIRSQHALTQFLHRAATARVDPDLLVNTATRRWRSIPAPTQVRS